MSFQPTSGSGFSFTGFGTQPAQQQTASSGFGSGGSTLGSSFGQSGSLFGTSQQQQPASAFGTSFGSGLGTTQPQQQTSAFGFGTSQPAQQPAAGFGSGGTLGATGFGTGGTLGGTGFGTGTSAFGQQSSSQPTAFGTSFGSGMGTSQQASTSFGGFGTTQPATQPAATGFGTGTTLGSGFGQTSSLFGTTQQQQPTFGSSFGTGSGPSQQSTMFGMGTGFGGAKPASAFSFPSFNTGQTTSLFGQPQQQQQQQFMFQPQPPQIDESQAFQQSVFQCHKFGDDRDSALAALNYLQACWGAGKGFYSQTLPPTTYNQLNPFYRFKAVGYAFMYVDSNEDGLVVINFKKPQEKLNAEESNIISAIQQMLNRPNITIRFSGTKAVSEESTVAIIFAEDRNNLRRVPATDMSAALCQPHLKMQLENLGVTSINPKVKPSPEQLKRYLENPPDGIDPRVWTKAQEDNPDGNSMIPIPLVGVEALKSRIEWQEKETLQHHARLKMIGDDVATLLNKHANLSAELLQMRRKHVLLAHRLISIICRQELMRKQGTTLHPDEEIFKKKLEEMDSELNSPTQYKGRLNELLSQIRLHKALDNRPIPKYNIDSTSLIPVKEFLGIQQDSVKHLVATIKTDEENVKEMTVGINKMLNKLPS